MADLRLRLYTIWPADTRHMLLTNAPSSAYGAQHNLTADM